MTVAFITEKNVKDLQERCERDDSPRNYHIAMVASMIGIEILCLNFEVLWDLIHRRKDIVSALSRDCDYDVMNEFLKDLEEVRRRPSNSPEKMFQV